jgi:hypothetical protein
MSILEVMDLQPPSGTKHTKRLILILAAIALLVLVLFAGAFYLQARAEPAILGQSNRQETSPDSTAFGMLARTPGFSFIQLSNTSNGDLTGLLAQEAAKARALGQKPFVLFSAGWCKSCQDLENSLHESLVRAAFEGTYIIRLDIDEWQPHLGKTGFEVHVLPVFYRIDDQGYPSGKALDGSAWGDNLPANIAAVMKQYFDGRQ